MIPPLTIMVTATHRYRPRFTRAILIVIVTMLSSFNPIRAHADDLQNSAQQLSDEAFAILNSISSDSSKAGAVDVMSSIASFAGDAQTLSTSIAKGDRNGAGSAMTALISDRRAVDEALEKNPGAIDSSKWAPLKAELASLQTRIPNASFAAASTAAESHLEVVKPPAGEAVASAPPASDEPRVEITSRVSDDTGIHIKGYLQGADLKSAGIYDGDAMVKQIDLSPTPGTQRVILDFQLEQVSPGESIRVTDSIGRMAEARIASDSTPAVESGGHEKMIELGMGMGATSSEEASSPAGSTSSRSSSSIGSTDSPNNIAEIPSESPPSPSHRHMHTSLAPLTGVQINILGIQQNAESPNTYGITGQISGAGVRRAGIYIDGKLAKPIPLTAGDEDNSFNVSFTMFGEEASIRAYGNGSNFVESGLDLTTANGTVFGANPPATTYAYPMSPYGSPYARSPYGYPPSPYGAANPYGPPAYGYPPNGYPRGYSPNGYPPNPYGYSNPPPNKPWWQKLL